MIQHHRDTSLADAVRTLLCAVLDCPCKRRPKERAVITLRFGNSFITFEGDFMATVKDSGGPFTADISGFVDAANNPVTDTDVPAWAVADTTIATVAVADPTKPQEATVTLTKKLGNTDVTATFGDPAAGGFVVTGNINVIADAAVGATILFSGPGIVPDA
jgi:hypothetical protein